MRFLNVGVARLGGGWQVATFTLTLLAFAGPIAHHRFARRPAAVAYIDDLAEVEATLHARIARLEEAAVERIDELLAELRSVS